MTFFEDAGFADGSATSTNYSSSLAIIFFAEDGIFHFDTGCNTGSDTHILSNGQMTMDTTVETDTLCTEDDKEKEDHVHTQNPTYIIENYELRMQKEDNGFRAYPQQQHWKAKSVHRYLMRIGAPSMTGCHNHIDCIKSYA